MASINIELDLNKLGLVEDEDGEYYPGPSLEEDLVQMITEKVTQRITGERELIEKIEERVRNIIDERVTSTVTGFLAGTIQPRDRYSGEPKGEPTTINEMTMVAVNRYLTAPASIREGYNSDKQRNLAQLLDELVKQSLTKEFGPLINEAKLTVRDTLMKQVVASVVEALTPKAK